MRMTKKDVVQQFRWDWSDFLKSNPNFRGDSIAKRCAFNDYVDSLNKDGLVTDYQASVSYTHLTLPTICSV